MNFIDIAIAKGYTEESLMGAGALKGDKGETGDSAYIIAVNNGFEGTEEEWIESLKVDESTVESIVNKVVEDSVNEISENISKLSGEIVDINNTLFENKISSNLLDPTTIIPNKRPSNWNGQTIANSFDASGYYTFEAIPVEEGCVYYFTHNNEVVKATPNFAKYDSNGNFVSGILQYTTFGENGIYLGVLIPEGVGYIRGDSNTHNFEGYCFKKYNGETVDVSYEEFGTNIKTSKVASQDDMETVQEDVELLKQTMPVADVPVICFSFDQVLTYDERFAVLDEFGLSASVVEGNESTLNVMKKLIQNGYDISPYLGNHTLNYSTDIEALQNNIEEKMNRLNGWGIYNPIMISCSGNKFGYAMETAINNLGLKFNYFRASSYVESNGNTSYPTLLTEYSNMKLIRPITMEDYTSAEAIINVINERVNRGDSIVMPMMHQIGYNGNITSEVYRAVVNHVVDLVKNGTVKCMNMHDYFSLVNPTQAKKDDYHRLLTAIFDKNIVD